MADITLINFNTGLNLSLGEVGTGSNRCKYLPVGSLYLVSSLEEKGFEVDFRDYQFLPPEKFYDIESLASSLKSSSDILGVSVSTDMLPFAMLFFKEIKERFPEKRIIIGGPGVKAIEEKLMKEFPWVDVLVFGDGEQTITELLDSMIKEKDLKKVEGISFRSKKGIFFTPPRKTLSDLDKLLYPDYHKIKLKDYDLKSIITARGCCFRCAFCNHSLDHTPVRYRSIDNVMKEIELLASEFGCTELKILDDNFAFNKKRARLFCTELKKLKVDLRLDISVTLSCLNENLMRELSSAGVTSILFGIESASNRILKRINKPFTLEQAEKAIKKSANYFDAIELSFIWGFPFETMQEFRKTLFYYIYYGGLFKEKNKTGLGMLIPLPESMLFKEFGNSIRFSEELSWNGLVSLNDSRDYMQLIPRKELISLIKTYPKIFSSFYYYPHRDIKKKNYLLKKNLEIT